MRIRAPFLLVAAFLVALAGDAVAQESFVYVGRASGGPSRISGLRVTPPGRLVSVPGSPFDSGGQRFAGAVFGNRNLVVSAVRRALFTADAASASVSGFSVDPETGALALGPGSPVRLAEPSFTQPLLEMALTPDGRFLFVAASGVDPHRIDVLKVGSGASLEAVAGARVTGEGDVGAIAVTPDGRFLVAAFWDGRIGVFRIGGDGRLSHVPGSPFEGDPGCAALSLTVGCAGDRVWVSCYDPGATAVAGYALAAEGGVTPLPWSPFVSRASGTAADLVLSGDGRFLFVSSMNAPGERQSSASALAIAPDGGLSLAPGSPLRLPPQLGAYGISADRTGRFLYVANGDGQLSALEVRADGSLRPVSGSPFVASAEAGAYVTNVAAFPGALCGGSPTLFVDVPDGVTADAAEVSGGVPGAFVAYDAPAVEAVCEGASVACDPPSGSFFPVGTTEVRCEAADSCGNVGRASFAVAVASPFAGGGVCLADDATGDAFSIVTDPAHALYGWWFYREAATGASVAGKARAVKLRPGRSLTASDDGRGPSGGYSMKLKVRFDAGTATARVRRRGGAERFFVRDGNLADTPPCE